MALDDKIKPEIIQKYVQLSNGTAVFDSAGKYGAGLAIEVLGKCLKQLKVQSGNVIISNKPGWVCTALQSTEPTFEPGIWKDFKYGAVQNNQLHWNYRVF